MDSPLSIWYCDKCGGAMRTEEAYVIWQPRGESDHNLDFRIVHQGKCDDKSFLKSAALTDFLGSDGVSFLLAIISDGAFFATRNAENISHESLKAYVDFFRRVQTPFYEEARKYFGCEEVRQELDGVNETAAYEVESLKRVIEAGRALRSVAQKYFKC